MAVKNKVLMGCFVECRNNNFTFVKYGGKDPSQVQLNCPITEHAMMCAVQLLRYDVHTMLLMLKSWLLIVNHIQYFSND